jgi:ribonuclease HI
MLTKEEAWDLALKHIQRHPSPVTNAMLDYHTIERPFGWVFSYNSKKFLDTGDIRFRLFGNVPVLVNKHNNEVVWITGHKKEERLEQIDEYERKWIERTKQQP